MTPMPSYPWQSPLALFLRSALWTILFPGIIAIYIPWRFFGVRYTSVAGVHGVIGLVLVLIGAALLLASIVEFARRGKGTLSPVDPPKRLVVTGPYRWVRNPMYAGVMFMLAGQSLLAARLGLVVYAGVLFGNATSSAWWTGRSRRICFTLGAVLDRDGNVR